MMACFSTRMQRTFLTLGLVLLFAGTVSAQDLRGRLETPERSMAQPKWKVPETLNDSNTKIYFDVDSTWHIVHGKLSGITGTIAPLDPATPLSVTAELHFPIQGISTGFSLRDDSLHEHFESETYPEATLTILGSNGTCTVTSLEGQVCKVTLDSELTIHGTTKKLELPATIVPAFGGALLSGSVEFDWQTFGIKDPSMSISTVKPMVSVYYSVRLKE